MIAAVVRPAGDRSTDRVATIRDLERTAANLTDRAGEMRREAEGLDGRADDLRWRAARLIAEELAETGKSQRQLASEIGKSHTHVRRMALVWRLYGGNQVSTGGRHEVTFNSLYRRALTAEDGPVAARGSGRRRWRILDPVVRGNARACARIVGGLDGVVEWLAAGPEGDADADVVLRAIRSRHMLIGRLLDGPVRDDDPDLVKWIASRDAIRRRGERPAGGTGVERAPERPATPVGAVRDAS